MLTELERLRQEANWAQLERRRLEGEVTQWQRRVEELEGEVGQLRGNLRESLSSLEKVRQELEEVKQKGVQGRERGVLIPLFPRLKRYWDGFQLIIEGLGEVVLEKEEKFRRQLVEIGWELEVQQLFKIGQFPVVGVLGQKGELEQFLRKVLEEVGGQVPEGVEVEVPTLLAPLPEKYQNPILLWRGDWRWGPREPEEVTEIGVGEELLPQLALLSWRLLLPSPLKLSLLLYPISSPEEIEIFPEIFGTFPPNILLSLHFREGREVIVSKFQGEFGPLFPEVKIFETNLEGGIGEGGNLYRWDFGEKLWRGPSTGIVGGVLERWSSTLPSYRELLKIALAGLFSHLDELSPSQFLSTFSNLEELVDRVMEELLAQQCPPSEALIQLKLGIEESRVKASHLSLSLEKLESGLELIKEAVGDSNF